jgi:DNA polymerase type B, organellar and viral
MQDLVIDTGDWLIIDSELVAQVERDKAYRLREAQRSKRRSAERRNTIPYEEREFIFWDGEGPRDGGYALFGNSKGMEICHKHLSTVECLDLMLQTEIEHPDSIHVGFGLNYDVSMWIKDLPWRHLNALKHFNRTTWKDYDIEYVPRHWFRIRARGLDFKIFDIVSFFATDFVGALRNFRIRTERCNHGNIRCENKCHCRCVLCRVERDKQRRSTFKMAEIRNVANYMRLELELGIELINELRSIFADAGFVPRSWHGPGALARMALNRHKIVNSMAVSPVDVQIASRYAFAGGRFELFKAGEFKNGVYSADINSAYPYFATLLPNLARGSWRRTRNYESGKFAVYNIRYEGHRTGNEFFKPMPLFRRHASGHVEWSHRVEGWYWNPEADLVRDDPSATFLDGWIFDEDDPTDRPFAWIAEYYEKRQRLKNAGSAAEFTFKLIINSIYGQLAQRTGWDQKNKKAPKFHQLEWAGWITSACRAYVYSLAKQCGNDLISIDTDGVYSLSPILVTNIGSALGQWAKSEYQSGVFWQSGIYALKSGGTWIKAKTRGIPKNTYSPEQLISALSDGSSLNLVKKTFIGFGLALNGQREKLNTWENEPHEFVFGGQGKRYHNTRGCKNGTTCRDGIHGLLPVPRQTRPNETCMSEPHYLPWLDNDKIMTAAKVGELDLVMFDANDLDEEDRYTVEEIRKDSGTTRRKHGTMVLERLGKPAARSPRRRAA